MISYISIRLSVEALTPTESRKGARKVRNAQSLLPAPEVRRGKERTRGVRERGRARSAARNAQGTKKSRPLTGNLNTISREFPVDFRIFSEISVRTRRTFHRLSRRAVLSRLSPHTSTESRSPCPRARAPSRPRWS